ncbi:MAG TPA: DEAD/DEAH box helicase [Oscillatoriaceae cyanobacterium M33_DOE_052]|uniref:DEAD/DEAH box helicase n=1 Tax=Planktothricoides sp. SpSt-374 TaxID=2282167 RepID=A0A7C3ZJF5_9CYAN|nr:DEAD/DEAH box helicase [Oscillatoriaceae cyanobacterium M33_DOE_052]
MAIVHGSWVGKNQSGYLFVWGETWRRLPSAATGTEKLEPPSGLAAHPLGMTKKELTDFLKSKVSTTLDLSSISWEKMTIALPTTISDNTQPTPLHSADFAAMVAPDTPPPEYLYPWQVEGICLPPSTALEFLQALPLGVTPETGSWLGNDLRYWSHVARWSVSLLARGKFLPGIKTDSEGVTVAIWQPLLDSATDQTRLTNFIQDMPLACRTLNHGAAVAVDIPPQPHSLLHSFLLYAIDTRVRAVAVNATTPHTGTPVKEWLKGLTAADGKGVIPATAVDKLAGALKTWTAPVQHHLTGLQKFRTCFDLVPPAYGDRRWTLQYCLQAADTPSFFVDAKTIWSHPVDKLLHRGRTIDHPQETFLAGLGLASRIYPPIEPSLDTQRPQHCYLNPQQAYEFIKSVAWRFQDSGLGVVLPPSLTKGEGWASQLGVSIRAELPKRPRGGVGLGALLEFDYTLTIGKQTLSKAEFDRLVALNSPLVEINGEWVELRPNDIRAAQEFFSIGIGQITLSLEDTLRLATGDTKVLAKLPVVNFQPGKRLEQLLETLTDNRSLKTIEPPKTLQGTLRPYQLRGVSWLAFLESWGLGACLADDMGLGKTVELIAFLLHLQEQQTLEAPFLLVCPTSVLTNWEREVKRFAPNLKVIVHHGDKRPKGKDFSKAVEGQDLVITSYPLVYRDIKSLQTVSWQGLVLDEAQNIKNSQAKQSKAIREVDASFRVALTGTPVENRLLELWSIMDFLNPGYLGARPVFQQQFGTRIEKYGDPEALQNLRLLVRPFILRRLKTDKTIIQDLPEKQEMPVFCGLTAEQAALYQKVVDESLAEVDAAEGIQRHGVILALLTKLKQICNHPAHFLKEDSFGNKARSRKLQRLEEMLEELLSEGDRALIFTQFAELGKLLQPYLEQKLNREISFLYGGTRKKQREDMIDRFQHDPFGPPIMILSLKAGGVGLNLTRANHVFHFDRWWNPAVENQATDRVFRIGQTRNVQVHKFVCTGTLEEKIHDLIESKKELAEQIVGSGENWLADLDSDSLRDLIVLDRTAILDEDE